MKVWITDFFKGECELTGKADVECVRVRLDDAAPEAVIAATELVRLLRFHRKQQEKQDQTRVNESQVQKGTPKC